MHDLAILVYLQTAMKTPKYRKVFVEGVLAGLSVQRELVAIDIVTYDGKLVEAVRNGGNKSTEVLIRELGDDYEKVLSEMNFAGWEERGELADLYSGSFVKGSKWVCNLYQVLTSVNLKSEMIKIKLWDVVEARMTELKAMI